MQPSASSTGLIGMLLEDRYRVVREIGRGGMGVVYEAEHVQLGKRVAIKLMLEKYAEDKEAVARFHREAFAASRIGNPHIIDVSHIGTAPDGRAFVVMELLSGQPLGTVMEKSGALAPARAVNIIRQVLRAVGAAHAKGILHRDLKPDNIFLMAHDDQHDFVKLLDFGISKIVESDINNAPTKLTTTGVVMGTPLYMAPEQAMGNASGHQADLYACGVILYEMLAGRPPFEGQTYAALIAKLLTVEPTNLKELQPHLPSRLVQATHKALEKDPTRRWQSAEEFIGAIPPVDRSPTNIELAGTVGVSSQSLPHASVITAGMTQAHPPAKGRGAMFAVIGAAILVLAAGVTFWAVRGDKDTPGTTPAASLASGAGTGPSVTPLDKPAADPPKPPAQTDAKKDPPPPLPAPTAGKLEVKSKPAGAKVVIDGVDYGAQPAVITLAAGKHRVHVELAGYEPIDSDEDVVAGEKSGITVALQKQVGSRPVANVQQRPVIQRDPQVKTPYDDPSLTKKVAPPTGSGSGAAGPSTTVPQNTTVKPPQNTGPGDTGSKPNPYLNSGT